MERIDVSNSIQQEIEIQQKQQIQIIDDLFLYIEKEMKVEIDERQKEKIIISFNDYLLGNAVDENYARYISAFIITKEKEPNYNQKINIIKEGLVIYDGVRYSSDLNTIGTWNTDLTIYLDTEHLFNAIGYNGDLYAEIFNDFYKLVGEINRSSKNEKKDKKIKLKYFPENKIEVENFLHVAESILEKRAVLSPSKTAMLTILKDCRTKSDVVAKQANFFRSLELKGIECEKNIEIYDNENYNYNVLDNSVLESLKTKTKENRKVFDEDECIDILNIFTKINKLRRGNSNVGFEQFRYIFFVRKSNYSIYCS